ncbi:DUF2321 domain-containing protein [Natrinema hispanicum]|nr:DUF2321 domain-containing protein [Natrinema hispanicum]
MKLYSRVCQNGHVLDTDPNPDADHRLDSPDFCPECGTEAFKTCPNCLDTHIPVNKPSEVPRPFDKRDLPNYCSGCGSDFPWVDPVKNHETRDGSFIAISDKDVSGRFYLQLVHEINQCYRVNSNNATYVLYRKLIENLIYDSLRAYHDSPEDIGLYFDKENGRRQNFDELVNSLKKSKDELKRFSSAVDSDLIYKIREFQDKGNSSAHTVENLVKDEEISEKSKDATYVAKVLFQLRENIYTTS